MTCPKCQGRMRQYERNSITIDQCTECRGLFLDRGELERLIDAEAAFYESAPSGQAGSPGQPP
ncbi:MAG: zf-TFIIB domain-containing protein, partial [Micromonosporaceae bacterium]